MASGYGRLKFAIVHCFGVGIVTFEGDSRRGSAGMFLISSATQLASLENFGLILCIFGLLGWDTHFINTKFTKHSKEITDPIYIAKGYSFLGLKFASVDLLRSRIDSQGGVVLSQNLLV